MPQTKVVLVTGATSGIGRETALYLGRLGYRVFATGRNPAALEVLAQEAGELPVEVLPLDVTQLDSVRTAGEAVAERTEGRGLDVLVNNAGFGTVGPLEVVDEQEVQAQFDTNVVGLLRVTQQFVPQMRERGAGTVINISSVVGKVALPLQGAYSATKHAVEALSDGLRMELAAFGVRVVIVEPGAIVTHFGETVTSTQERYADSPYGPALQAWGHMVERTYRGAPGPEVIARAIARILRKRRPAARYVVPWSNRLFIWLLGALPRSWADVIIRRVLRLTPKALVSRDARKAGSG